MDLILYEKRDPDRSLLTELVRDDETGLPIIYARQNTGPIVEDAKRQAANFDPHIARGSHWRQVATIPTVVYMRLMRMGITRDRKAMLKWLSRRDARYFRTDGGGRLA